MLIRSPNPVLLIALVLMTGCSHTRTLDPSPSSGTLHEINERAERKTATVTLSTGEQVNAKQLHLAPDVATWVTEGGSVRSEPLGKIAEVAFESAGQGAMDGLKIGVSIGATAAVLAAVTTPPCDPNPEQVPGEFFEGLFCVGPGGAAFLAGTLIGGAASLAGLIVGGLKTSSTTYEVSDAEAFTPEAPIPARIAAAPSERARRPLSDEEQNRMMRKLRALHDALATDPGTEELRREVDATRARAEEGYLFRDELSGLVDLFRQYRIE